MRGNLPEWLQEENTAVLLNSKMDDFTPRNLGAANTVLNADADRGYLSFNVQHTF